MKKLFICSFALFVLLSVAQVYGLKNIVIYNDNKTTVKVTIITENPLCKRTVDSKAIFSNSIFLLKTDCRFGDCIKKIIVKNDKGITVDNYIQESKQDKSCQNVFIKISQDKIVEVKELVMSSLDDYLIALIKKENDLGTELAKKLEISNFSFEGRLTEKSIFQILQIMYDHREAVRRSGKVVEPYNREAPFVYID